MLSHGRYELPLDSIVIYKNGHITGLVDTEDGIVVQELALKGL